MVELKSFDPAVELRKISDILNKCKQMNIKQENDFISILATTVSVFSNNSNSSTINWKIFFESILSHITASIGLIQRAYGGAVISANLLEELNKIISIIQKEILPQFGGVKETVPIDYQREKELYQSLQIQDDAFSRFLGCIRATVALPDHLRASPHIFISHAWGQEDLECEERWLDTFVDRLDRDLRSVGFNVSYDKENSGAGKNLYTFMNQEIDRAKHVIVVCSRTMIHKFNNRECTGVRYEYQQYINNYRLNQKNRFIIPLCLNKEGNAPGLVGTFAEVSVYNNGYIKAFLELVTELYKLGNEFWLALNSQLNQSELNVYLKDFPEKIKHGSRSLMSFESSGTHVQSSLPSSSAAAAAAASTPLTQDSTNQPRIIEGEYIPASSSSPSASQPASSSIPKGIICAKNIKAGTFTSRVINAGTVVIGDPTPLLLSNAQGLAQLGILSQGAKPPQARPVIETDSMEVAGDYSVTEFNTDFYADDGKNRSGQPFGPRNN